MKNKFFRSNYFQKSKFYVNVMKVKKNSQLSVKCKTCENERVPKRNGALSKIVARFSYLFRGDPSFSCEVDSPSG